MENEKITWSPEAEVVLTGREFEAFTRMLSLYDIPLSEFSMKDLQNLIVPAVQAGQEVLKRMLESGIATKEVISEN